MEEQKQKRTRKANPDRITLSKGALENLSRMIEQLEKAFGGVLALKNKDLASFLIEVRGGELTKVEMKMIREKYFDEVRVATWALQKLREAKERGENLKFSEILSQLETPLVKGKAAPKAPDKRKSPIGFDPGSSSSNDQSHKQREASRGASKGMPQDPNVNSEKPMK